MNQLVILKIFEIIWDFNIIFDFSLIIILSYCLYIIIKNKKLRKKRN